MPEHDHNGEERYTDCPRCGDELAVRRYHGTMIDCPECGLFDPQDELCPECHEWGDDCYCETQPDDHEH